MRVTKKDRTKNYKRETTASEKQITDRRHLYKLFEERPMDTDQLLVNLGLYMRSSALTKILFLNEAYRMIKNQPGIIVELGSWWGQNLIVFENLRAIYEPWEQRRIVGFDTFEGYKSISVKDIRSETIKEGGYAVIEGYKKYLEDLIDYHEKNSVSPTVNRVQLVKGNAAETVPKFFTENNGMVVALVYSDLALYEPSKAAFEAIRPHLLPGSVVMLDECNHKDFPGETMAFKEVFAGASFSVKKSDFMPGRTYFTMK
ncbi:MAG: dTDP-6-deoxy-L-hexose 3-O-methyltransferase [Parcubacteria group bacterium]|nr:dTDP-6-deoxy-L-hexose 3-O-methyltransferase [Parcubacteria group bacterium]